MNGVEQQLATIAFFVGFTSLIFIFFKCVDKIEECRERRRVVATLDTEV